MTIGQRIAHKRKQLSLSQEALGETLGVSRQSIYKWESDTALPEVDKLISLSRLFGVSVGWLLGVEEEASAQAESEMAPGPAGIRGFDRRVHPDPPAGPDRTAVSSGPDGRQQRGGVR